MTPTEIKICGLELYLIPRRNDSIVTHGRSLATTSPLTRHSEHEQGLQLTALDCSNKIQHVFITHVILDIAEW